MCLFPPRRKAEEDRVRKEEEKVRRELIKQEYLRRKQLKLMEDMDTVMKPRLAGSKQRRARPKSIHRDSMDSTRTPARAAGNHGDSLSQGSPSVSCWCGVSAQVPPIWRHS